MRNLKFSKCLIGILISTFSCFSSADDAQPGTVISAENIDNVKSKTFEGKTIASMLTERLEWRIRNSGMKITLSHSKDIPLDPAWIKASNKNIGKAKLNPQTRQVEGWTAGAPFPDVKMDDPAAAEKLIWNWYYGQNVGDVSAVPFFTYLLVDGNKGIHSAQVAEYTRYSLKGKLSSGDKTVEGDGEAFGKQLLFFKEPKDIKGLGTFTLRHDSAQVDDVWAYIPAVRRVRRLSGGAWMDPIGGTDQLTDDLEAFHARPSWYKGYKLLGKRWVLATANGKLGAWNRNGASDTDRYPVLDLSAKPFWNLNGDVYEPREVYVIEAETPPEHPYSKKVLYMDVKYPRFYYAEAYDRKGEFWKFMEFHSFPAKGDDGFQEVRSNGGLIIDFKRNHATVFLVDTASWKTNPKGVKESDVSLSVLEAAGR